MRALVLDDEAEVARVTSRFLARMGWFVDISATAQAAEEMIARGHYDLLVCDVNIGDTDGIAVAAALQRARPMMKVLIVSGLPDNLERARAAGFTQCLQKPFTPSEFESLVGPLPPEPPLRGLLLCLVLLLSGCATWSKHGIAPRPPEKIRVAVLPIQIAVTIKHLKNIETIPKSAKAPADERDWIQRKMRQTADDITHDIEAKLSASYFFEVVPDSDVRRALEAAGLASSTAALTNIQVKDLGKSLGAQVVLATKLSGYGAIKKRWLIYMIGSGVLEGMAQGVAVGAAVSNPWVAVGIAVEEVVQETVVWGGGAFLFGKTFSPVILEGQLVSAVDGRTIWSGTELASSNRKAIKALPKEDRGKRELRLRLTAQKAAGNLVKALDKKAWANLKKAGDRPTPPQRETP